MAAFDTLYTPEDAIRRINHIVHLLHKHLKEHSMHNVFNKLEADKKIFENEVRLKAILVRFDDTILKQIYSDAKKLSQLAHKDPRYLPHIRKSLKQVEILLGEIRKDQIFEIKRAKFLVRMADHLSREVKKVDKDINNSQKKIENYLRSFNK